MKIPDNWDELTPADRMIFCEDCWSVHLGKPCANPKPASGIDALSYYQKRRAYLISKKEDRWGDNDAGSPEQAWA